MHANVEELMKIKVGAVSYLNTKPLLYGIKQSAAVMKQVELVEDYPAKIAKMLLDGSIDAGLVPVAIIPRLSESYIISDYCIGANGEVASVCIFSEVPLENAERILLDYQSRTSAALCKILLKHYWKLDIAIEDAKTDFANEIKGTTAGMLIGDRALVKRNSATYMYDLAAAWKDFTGLPFVFAAWIANKKLPAGFIAAFNAANKEGLKHIHEVAAANENSAYNIHDYYTKNISYTLDEEKKKGMQKFLAMINEL